MSLTNSYTGGFRRCSTQKTACTLPCKEMQVQFQRLAGHGQWSWRQWFAAWGLSGNLKQKSLRKHNTKCRDSEVHQHINIQALSRIWTKCGKKQFGKHPSHLPACDAESVCTARSQNMSWLALMLPVTKCREANILQSILKVSQQIWRFPTKQYTFGNRSHPAIRSMAHEPRKPRLNDRRCSWASYLCKRRYHRTSHLTAQRKKRGIKRISGKLGQREQRNWVNGGTTPRAGGCLWPSRGCTIWFCQS